MLNPSHLPWFGNPNNICWRVQILKVFTVQISPDSCYLLPLATKYSFKPRFFHTPSTYAVPSVLQTKFHTYTEKM
jgi:hypothetical protein